MAFGILIMGLNGCGKTTVGSIVARKLGFLHMDAEDYYFSHPGDYTLSRTQEEVHRLMEADASISRGFVLSCVRCNLSDALVQQVRLAVVLRTSPESRAQRIHAREEARFGKRVQPGGDLYESQLAFRAFAASRSEDTVTQSLSQLSCPVIELDAALSPEILAEKICLLTAS